MVLPNYDIAELRTNWNSEERKRRFAEQCNSVITLLRNYATT